MHIPCDDEDYQSPVAFYRECLAHEVRVRAPELAAFADRIEALPDDDPRFVWIFESGSDGDNMLDCCTADEFATVIEPYLDDDARRRLGEGVRFGPDFTHRFFAHEAARAEIAGIVAANAPELEQHEPRLN